MFNFPSPKNLSYSIANPYPSQEAISKGYQWIFNTSPDFALAAERNDAGQSALSAATPTAPLFNQNNANSSNHDREGFNVLYADGHVDWATTMYCGFDKDPIMCANPKPTLNNGIVTVTLQPETTDPQWEQDSVMLPNKW